MDQVPENRTLFNGDVAGTTVRFVTGAVLLSKSEVAIIPLSKDGTINKSLLRDNLPLALTTFIKSAISTAQDKLGEKGVFAVPTKGVCSHKHLVLANALESADVRVIIDNFKVE